MAAGTETLKRTPLHDRHAAAGARLVPFAGGRCRCSTPGSARSTWRSATRVGVFDVSHMGEIETSGPGRGGVPPAHPLQRREQDRRRRRAVLRAQQGGRRRARRPLHLPPRPRPLPHRHERVEPREGPRVVQAARARASTSTVEDRLHDYAMLAVQGPEARALVERLADGELPKRFRTATLDGRRRAGRARRRHRLHGRGRRRAAARPRARDRRLGRADREAAPPPSASAPATRCASRSASTSTATTSPRTAARSRPASAGAARRTRASSAPTPSATAARERHRARSSSPSPSPAPGSPARATRSSAAAW